MSIPNLIRDAEYVKSKLHKTESGRVVTASDCTIQIPESFVNKNLAVIGTETFIFGFFPIIIDGRYAVNKTIAMMRITPSSTEKIVIDNNPYIEFQFAQGDTVIYTTALVVTDTLVYYMYDQFIAKGNIPWYMNYYDIANMFDTAKEHAGVDLGSRSVIELIISSIARDPDDMTLLYRHVFNAPSDLLTKPPVTVPFRSVIWNTSDTTSKLNGAYYSDGINSALVNTSESVELIEGLLRT